MPNYYHHYYYYSVLCTKTCVSCRSLARRGELIPLYNKAQEKAAALEKRKKEKGGLLS
jgi:hypothetical protein